MKKVIAYIAMSIDGYIADKDGGVSWLSGDGSDVDNFGSYPNFIETIDTIILGYSTYHQIVTKLSPNEWAYKGKKTFVLTHRDIKNTEEIIFTSESIEKLLLKLKEVEGKNIWICGGASVIQQTHNNGLIDEYVLSIIPTILGNGIKLFDQFDVETKLKLKSTESYNGIVDLVYQKRSMGNGKYLEK